MSKTLSIVLFLISTASLAQLPPRVLGPGQAPQITADPEQAGSISGLVLNSETSTGLRDATIQLINVVLAGNNAAPAFTTTTDNEGKFAMKDIPPGEYRLTAQRHGFLTTFYGARRPGSIGVPITLAAKQVLTNLTINMYRTAAIAGRVTDEFGEPMERVRVEALRHGYNNLGQRELMPVSADVTNDLGDYRIFGLTPGRYYLRATPVTAASIGIDRSAGARPRGVHMPVYYPGVPEPSLATSTDVAAGSQQPGIDFRLQREPAFRLQAKVANPPAGVRLSVQVRPRAARGAISTVRTGAVGPRGEIDMDGFRSGDYTLMTYARTAEGALHGRADFTIGDEDVKDLGVLLAPGVDVPGRLIMEDDTPIDLANMQVSLRSPANASIPMTMAPVNKDGTFLLKGVPRDALIFKMYQLPENAYSVSVRLGDQEVQDLIVDVTYGVPGPLAVRLRGKSPRVEGTVIDKAGRAVAGATVVMVPNSPAQRGIYNFYMTERTNQQGQFAIRWLWPGEFKLYAWEEVEASAWMDDEFLKPFLSKSTPFNLKEGDKHQVQVQVIPADQ